MQISIEERKNTKKFRSFKRPKASSPIIWEMLDFSPFAEGGVFGRVKLNRPSTKEAIEVIKNVCDKAPEAMFSMESHPKVKLMSRPATIQPIVPQTLMNGKSFEGSFICRKETEFTSAKVGI